VAKVKIYVSPKKGIFDPQGQAAENALKQLGFADVSNVRIGKYITLEIDGSSEKEIEEMCHKLLANPIIEEYEFEVLN
jgi:phosphoribosylformylglycinamidine synthase